MLQSEGSPTITDGGIENSTSLAVTDGPDESSTSRPAVTDGPDGGIMTNINKGVQNPSEQSY